jgi:hypothetical protein
MLSIPLMAMLFAVRINDLWYSLPLIVSVSLVYEATRYEHMPSILHAASRFGFLVTLFMVAAFAILYCLSVWL